MGGISNDANSGHVRRNLLKELQVFCGQIVFIIHEAGGVAARMGEAIDDAGSDRIGDGSEHDRQSAVDMLQRHDGQGAARQDDVWRERDQLRSIFCAQVGIILAPAGVDPYIAANTPARFLQALLERRKSILPFWIVRSPVHEHANAPHALALLRARRERPRSQRAAKQGDELTSLQWAELHMLPLAGEVRGSIADWRGSSQGLIAMRDFGPAKRRSGSRTVLETRLRRLMDTSLAP